MKLKVVLLILLVAGLVGALPGWAAEEKEISVYYPSPYGEYKELRTEALVVGTGNYMDRTTVLAEDGVILAENGLAVTSGRGVGNYTTVGVGVARLRVDSDSGVVGPANGSLIYTSNGQLFVGRIDSAKAEPIVQIRANQGNGFPGGDIDIGNYPFRTYNATGVRVDSGNDEVAIAMDSNNGVGLWVRPNSGGDIAVWADKSGASPIYQLSSTNNLYILGGWTTSTKVSIGGKFLYITKSPAQAVTNDSFDIDGPVVYIDTQDADTPALYWGTTDSPYGFLGEDSGHNAVRIGAVDSSNGGAYNRLELATNNTVGISIADDQKVMISQGAAFDGNARLTVRPGSLDTNTASFEGNSHTVAVDTDGRLAIDNPSTWNYPTAASDSEGVILNVNGYTAAKDIYLTEPKSGNERWASEAAGVVASYKAGLSGNVSVPEDGTYLVIAKACVGNLSGRRFDKNCTASLSVNGNVIDTNRVGDYVNKGGKGGGANEATFIGTASLSKGGASYSIGFNCGGGFDKGYGKIAIIKIAD